MLREKVEERKRIPLSAAFCIKLAPSLSDFFSSSYSLRLKADFIDRNTGKTEREKKCGGGKVEQNSFEYPLLVPFLLRNGFVSSVDIVLLTTSEQEVKDEAQDGEQEDKKGPYVRFCRQVERESER